MVIRIQVENSIVCSIKTKICSFGKEQYDQKILYDSFPIIFRIKTKAP